MVICEVISCINSNRQFHLSLLNRLRKTGRFGLSCFYKSLGKCFVLWHLYVPSRRSRPSHPNASISSSTERKMTLAWSEKLKIIKILSWRKYWATTGPMTTRILVVRPSRVRFYRCYGRKSHNKIPIKLSQSIMKATSLCYQMFFRVIGRWESTKLKSTSWAKQPRASWSWKWSVPVLAQYFLRDKFSYET